MSFCVSGVFVFSSRLHDFVVLFLGVCFFHSSLSVSSIKLIQPYWSVCGLKQPETNASLIILSRPKNLLFLLSLEFFTLLKANFKRDSCLKFWKICYNSLICDTL